MHRPSPTMASSSVSPRSPPTRTGCQGGGPGRFRLPRRAKNSAPCANNCAPDAHHPRQSPGPVILSAAWPQRWSVELSYQCLFNRSRR